MERPPESIPVSITLISIASPLAYFITFECYGAHLPGDEPGSVDRDDNLPGGPYAAPNYARMNVAQLRMRQPPYLLDESRRQIVLDAMHQVCSYRAWELIAAHVRTNHVHVVIAADVRPEALMHDLKAYSSRLLNQCERDTKRWSRHGSTRYLWTAEEVRAAARYVMNGQGEPMAVYPAAREQAAP